jgi:glycosyltransferase involved in cell wall biosynthesis
MTPSKPPRFSIIVPHYDGAISDDRFLRGYSSLVNQVNAPHYEILIYHDGPKSRPIPQGIPVIETSQRQNDWGHSLRDLGIREAKGEYIIHCNADNVLYPFALQEMEKELLRQRPHIGNFEDKNEIVIFPILMRGMQTNGSYVWRETGNEENIWMIFSGFPTLKYNIDCMQLVMKREIWLMEGGWKDKSEESDGNMYPHFVTKYGAKYVGRILGEHW